RLAQENKAGEKRGRQAGPAMPIRFRCVYCNQLLGISRRKAGTIVRCTTCEGQLIVPNPDDPATTEPAGAPDDGGTPPPPAGGRRGVGATGALWTHPATQKRPPQPPPRSPALLPRLSRRPRSGTARCFRL